MIDAQGSTGTIRLERLRVREVSLIAKLAAVRAEIEAESRIAELAAAKREAKQSARMERYAAARERKARREERRKALAERLAESKRIARREAEDEQHRELEATRRMAERVLLDVAMVSGLPTNVVRRGTRRPAVRARWAWLWLAREVTGASLPVLGELARRDHTTVANACSMAPIRPESRAIIRGVLSGQAAEVLGEIAA